MPYFRKLESGKWQATVRMPDGRRRSRTDPLKGVVKVWAEEAEADMRRGQWADPREGKITIAQWWEKWSKTRVIETATRDRDASHWRVHVEPRWGSVQLAAVAPWDVEAWVADMAKAKVGPSSLAQSVRLLGHMLADAAEHRLIKADPTANVTAPKPPRHVDRFLSRDEFDALMAAMPTEKNRAILATMTLAGLRWGEVAGLHSHRVDLGRSRLRVVEVARRDRSIKDRPKSEAGMREVFVTPELAAHLMPFLGEGLVFDGLDYTNWRRRVWVPSVERAGLALPLPTPHDCRHSFGSWLAQEGFSPVDIMAVMGHSSLRATERYLHATSARFDRGIAAMLRARAVEA